MNTAQAAEYLGVNASRVRQMILREGLQAEKIGRDWIIQEADLARKRQEREAAEKRPGRPFKKAG